MSDKISFCQYLPSSKSKGSNTKASKSFITALPPCLPTPGSRSTSGVVTPKKRSKRSFMNAPAPSVKKNSKKRTDEIVRHAQLQHHQQSSGSPSRSRTPSLSKFNSQDYDILHIDAHIRDMLRKKISTIPELQKDLKTLAWIVNNSDDPLDRIQAKTDISILRRRIQDIENSFEYGFYILRTRDILEEYIEIHSKTKSRSFVSIGTVVDEKSIARKNSLIANYIRIAREYVEIDTFVSRSSKLVCTCGSTEFEQDLDEAIYTCKGCGNTLELLDDSPTYKDTDRVNMASRYQYTCRGHFIEAMNKYEGKQNTTIPAGVISLLKREMKNHNLTTETTAKDHLYMFLSEKKLSAHYEDINLIYFIITEIEPPNITEYRSRLLELFDQQEEAYTEVKDPERTNSLNVNYKLYKLLQLIGYPCQKDDFYILRTRTKLEEHDEKWREIIEILRKKYPDQKVWRFIGTI